MTSKVLLRNSERTSWTTCRFRWLLTYNGVAELKAVPLRSREPAKALWFGDLVHQGLAAHYKKGRKRGPKPARTFLRLYDADERISAVLRNEEGEWESLRDLGRGMLEGYVEEFGARDMDWEVIAPERTFRLPLRPEHTGLDFTLIVVGTFDGVWRNVSEPGRVVFKEFKTASTISTDALGMDEQASLYWTYGPKWLHRQGILPEGVYPSEILYTFLRKAIRNPDHDYDEEGRKLNKDGSVSKVQPPAFYERQPVYRDLADRENAHERFIAQAAEMAAARAGDLVPYKIPGPLHMPNCRGCPVREACELHETGGDWLSMLRATTEPWEPYAAHEITERR